MEPNNIPIPARASLIALAAASQAAIPLGRLHGAGLAAFVTIPAVAAAGVGYAIATAKLPEANTARRSGIASLAGALVAGGQTLNVLTDRAAIRWLAPRTSAPRLTWMAINAGIGAASVLIDTRTNPPKAEISA